MLNWDDPSTWQVLIVDDEPDNLELVTETLEFSGALVKASDRALTAQAILQDFTPNLILLDLSMPEMDGWTLLRIIKSDLSLQRIPVLAMTAHAMAGDKERALEAGFDGYISKPVNIPRLAQDIAAAYLNQSHEINDGKETKETDEL